MLKYLDAQFTEPICKCLTDKICLSVLNDNSFKFICKGCDTFIVISWDSLSYVNSFDKNYPKYKCKMCGELHDTGLTHDQATIKSIIE